MDSLPDLALDRMHRRRSLMDQFDGSRRDLDQSKLGSNYGQYQEMAYNVVASPKVREALDIRTENDTTRDRYGRTLFGQSCLAARRMVEAGTRLVSVFWDEYGLAGDAWDTHYEHFPWMVPWGLMPSKWYMVARSDLGETGRSVTSLAMSSVPPMTWPRFTPPPTKRVL